VLAAALERLGFPVICPSYGHVWSPWKTRHTSRRVAKQWSNFVKPTDVLIGHSNGARVAWEMTYYTGDKVTRVFFINAALDHDLVPGPSVARCFIFYNGADKATRLARLIPLSDWGDMGRVGYRADNGGWGPDQRMENHEIGVGHSPFRDPAVASTYAVTIATLLHRL